MPSTADSLRGEAISVHELLSPNSELRYRAPEFQRHYVWEAEGSDSQIARFWADLDRLKDEGTDDSSSDSLFLGAIVLQLIEPGGPLQSPLLSIIDGQQRLTTLYLVFVALAEAYQECGQHEKAGDIERQYLLSQTSSRKNEPRLHPTISDTEQFQEILSCLRNPRPKIKGVGYGGKSGRMTEAWAAIRSQVRNLCSDGEGELSQDHIDHLLTDIAKRIELVSITLGTQHDPHEVYERLNTGGAPLKVIDLTRNEVFLVAGADATERFHYDYWGPFEEDLGIHHQDSYFFPYALIRDSSTTKAKMYQRLRQYWRSEVMPGKNREEAAQAIIEDLREFLPAYHALVGVSRPSEINHDSWEAIKRLQRLEVPSTTYPYLIRLIDSLLKGSIASKSLIDVIGVIDSFIVRRSFSGYGNTGIHTVFKNLWSMVGADTEELIRHLDVRTIQFPNDDEFKQSILESRIATANKCRYILTEYERSFSKGDPSNWEPKDITVDHLMPQNPDFSEWPGISRDDHERLLHTWANLVPLTTGGNSAKSAANWEQAKTMMREDSGTVFKSTRAVFDDYERWDTKAILDRAEKLAVWALQRWPKG